MADAPPLRSHQRLFALAGPAVGVAVALWLVGPVFGPRPPAGEDVMAHLVRADFGIAHLVAHGRLDGWFPRFVLGHQEFLFNGPGLTWLMALVRTLTLGAMSNTGALKVVAIASFAAVPPSVCFLARSYGLGRRASGLAAVLALLVSNPYGVGLEGLFKVGLVPHQVGAVFFCLALGALIRVARDDGGRWGALAAASLAALVVTHLISALVLGVVLALTLAALGLAGGLSGRGLARLAGMGVVAAGLAGFWLVPLLAHRDLRGVVATWGTPPIGAHLARIASGDLLLPPGVALLVVGGWLVQLRHLRRRPVMLAWVAVPFGYLIVAHGSLALLGQNEVTLQLANRGLGYAGLIGVLALAALVAAASRPLGLPGHLAALAVATVVVVAFAPGREAAGQASEPIPEMRAAATELARLVPEGARFATQRDFPAEIRRTGVIHPELWLARAAGRNSLNGFNLESSSTPQVAFEPDRLDERDPAVSADQLARLGVTHVVTTTEGLADDLAASGRFAPAWRSPPLAIFAVRPAAGAPDPASLVSGRVLSARLTEAAPEHLVFEVGAPRATTATVALAWSPKWHGRLDGATVRLDRTSDGLVQVAVSAGGHRLRLDYRSDAWDRLGATVTVLTLLAGAVVLAQRRRQASQPMSRIFSRTA